ncbi:MAG: DUF1552 domain-containing protein [Vicinamibacterales bacterium]
MFVTGMHLSRRAVLRGIGVTLALPWLDAMAPAGGGLRAQTAPPLRLVCIENVHGAAGSSAFGAERHLWAPGRTGSTFDLRPTSLRSLEAFKDVLTIVSGLDVPSAEPFTAREIGGDHFRSSAVFLTQAHPKQTPGPDVEVGTSLDQLYARRVGRETPIPSLQLSIEDVNQAGGCQYDYSCAYVDTISWSSPTTPLPMIRDPRVVFDEIAGVVGGDLTAAERAERRAEDRSILDWLTTSSAALRRRLGAADRARLDDYLTNVREIERRLQVVEAWNRTGEPRELPSAPDGVPDSFEEHVRLMFALQTLAFSADVTRVVTFKLGRDGSNRAYPASGFGGPFHNTSHHGARPERILDLAKINAHHVAQVAPFLGALQATADADGTLLDHTLVLYGSPMGDPNLHNHRNVPFFLAGHANGALGGGVHLAAARGTSLANVLLSILHLLGFDDLETFGDSDGTFDLNPSKA